MPPDYLLRPMTAEDVEEVEALTADAFYDLDRRTHRTGWPEPQRRTPERSAAWRERLHHLLRHDPGGCWVAQAPRGVVGAAGSLVRDLTWILALYAVTPALQGRGVGRQLLDAARSSGRGCLRVMISATEDPLALRRYRRLGCTLHPMMLLHGSVARSVLPVGDAAARVREGSLSDLDLLDSVDRRVRDAAHGVDHAAMARSHRLVVSDRSTGSGYVYVMPGGGPYLLAATNRRTATALLWEALAATDPETPCEIGHVTAPNEWAVDVGMAARMQVYSHGFLALAHLKPPMPYLPCPHFL